LEKKKTNKHRNNVRVKKHFFKKKQLGIKIANTPKIDEKQNFANLQDTSKWFPNAYKAPQEQVFIIIIIIIIIIISKLCKHARNMSKWFPTLTINK